jgi:hypothetical protein
VYSAVTGCLSTLLGAETIRRILGAGHVPEIVGQIGGALAVVDGLNNLVQGVMDKNGMRIWRGGIEMFAGGVLIAGYAGAGGIILSSLVVVDGIQRLIEGDIASGAIKTAGGGFLLMASVAAVVPGIGTIVAVGLGLAGVVTLLADTIVSLFTGNKNLLPYYGPFPIRAGGFHFGKDGFLLMDQGSGLADRGFRLLHSGTTLSSSSHGQALSTHPGGTSVSETNSGRPLSECGSKLSGGGRSLPSAGHSLSGAGHSLSGGGKKL